jgi:hypothetical protein
VRALKLLQRVNASPELLRQGDPALLYQIGATHRTAWETFLIMYASSLVRRFETPFTTQKLASLLAGDDIVSGRDTEPWNIQFELYVAAWLILGGAEVTPGEPDLRLLYGREQVGVAAKRVTSLQPKQLKERVKSAVDQIQRSCLRGFMALNLDSRFADLDPANRDSDLIPEFDRRFDELNRYANYFAPEPQVLGVMSFGYAWSWLKNGQPDRPPRMHQSAPFRWLAFSDTPEDRQLFEDFMRGWEGRMRNRLERLYRGEFD